MVPSILQTANDKILIFQNNNEETNIKFIFLTLNMEKCHLFPQHLLRFYSNNFDV